MSKLEFLLLEAGDLEGEEEEGEAIEEGEKSLVLSAMEESSSGKKTTRRPMFLLVSVVVFVALDFGFDLAKKPIFVSACLCGCENAGKFLTLVLFLDALEMIM